MIFKNWDKDSSYYLNLLKVLYSCKIKYHIYCVVHRAGTGKPALWTFPKNYCIKKNTDFIALHKINTAFQPSECSGFFAVGGWGVVVFPSGERRQTHQNRLGAPAGFQSEFGAFIPHQIKLCISAAPQQLPASVFFVKRQMSSALNNIAVHRHKSIAYSYGKIK